MDYRSSELTAHYIIICDSVTGLVTSLAECIYCGNTADLCQTEKVCQSVHFLNVILIFHLWYLTGLIGGLIHLSLSYVFILLFRLFYFLGCYNHVLCNCEVGVLAICLLSHILEYIMVHIILIKSAACIGLDCFHQLPCVYSFLFLAFVWNVFLKELISAIVQC